MNLEIKDLSLNYFGHADSLHSITYTFTQGLNVIFGTNGSGKTSLLKAIASVNPYHDGTVTLDGEPLSYGKSSEISFVFDDLGFFQRKSLKYNLSYPFKIRKKSKEEFMPIIEKWLKEFSIPETLLDTKVFRLDDDFKVMASLIRGFYRNSKIILLDNPLSILNPYDRNRVFLTLAKYLKQTDAIVIYSTDSTEEVRLLNAPTLVLSYGYVSDNGKASEFVENPQTLSTAELFIPYFNEFNVDLLPNGFSLFDKLFDVNFKGTLAESFVGKNVVLGFAPEAVIEGEITAVSPLTLSTAKKDVYLLKVDSSEIYSDKPLRKIGFDVKKIKFFDPHTERLIYGFEENVNEEND